MAGASLQLPSAANGLRSQRWHTNDPRSSSTQSLVPSLREKEGKRTLLVIYIHGFMGNDSSFRSFPAHVHSFLREALVDTHVIHSKIYPRYKTYKAIEVARDNFSAWLQPHESPTTDAILIGHSMGGLLAGEVALMVCDFFFDLLLLSFRLLIPNDLAKLQHDGRLSLSP